MKASSQQLKRSNPEDHNHLFWIYIGLGLSACLLVGFCLAGALDPAQTIHFGWSQALTVMLAVAGGIGGYWLATSGWGKRGLQSQ